MEEKPNPKKIAYTVTVNMTGHPSNWNVKTLVDVIKRTKSQAIIQELDKEDARVSNMDLASVKQIIMNIANNKKLDN